MGHRRVLALGAGRGLADFDLGPECWPVQREPGIGDRRRSVGSWLKDLFRLPASSSFALVTGCQMAHTTCLAARGPGC